MIKEVEMDALVFDTDRYGHTTIHRERRVEKVDFTHEDRHCVLCNLCIEKNYPECRKTCQGDEFWRKRHGVTL